MFVSVVFSFYSNCRHSPGLGQDADTQDADLRRLLRAGYRPVTVAMGNAMYALNPATYWSVRTSWRNEEIEEYTRGFFDARETAMDILAMDLFREFPHGHPDCPAGVVGMTVNEEAHDGIAGVIEFTAIGTAVTGTQQDDPRKAKTHPSPTIVVPLDR